MKEERFYLELDNYEHGLLIRSLNEKKAALQHEGKITDAVDDLIIKVGLAPTKRFRVIEKGNRNEAR